MRCWLVRWEGPWQGIWNEWRSRVGHHVSTLFPSLVYVFSRWAPSSCWGPFAKSSYVTGHGSYSRISAAGTGSDWQYPCQDIGLVWMGMQTYDALARFNQDAWHTDKVEVHGCFQRAASVQARLFQRNDTVVRAQGRGDRNSWKAVCKSAAMAVWSNIWRCSTSAVREWVRKYNPSERASTKAGKNAALMPKAWDAMHAVFLAKNARNFPSCYECWKWRKEEC